MLQGNETMKAIYMMNIHTVWGHDSFILNIMELIDFDIKHHYPQCSFVVVCLLAM